LSRSFLSSSTCFPSSLWTCSVVRSQWSCAHFVCWERSWSLNWLSSILHCRILTSWRCKEGAEGTLPPQVLHNLAPGIRKQSWLLKRCSSIHACLVKAGRMLLLSNRRSGMRSFIWMPSYHCSSPSAGFWHLELKKHEYLRSYLFQSPTKKARNV